MADFKLPDVGEGISEAELIEWRIAVGDDIDEDQIVAFVGTDKVNVELPSPRAGRVVELCWDEGDIVPVGEVLVRLDTDDATTPSSDAASAPSSDAAPGMVATPTEPPTPERTASAAPAVVVAAPSTRRYAAQLGVDLRGIAGSGPGGRILREDVRSVHTDGLERDGSDVDAPVAAPVAATSTYEPLRGIRSVAARRMATSAQQTATSTTTFEVDADALLALLDEVRTSPRGDQVKLTPLAIVAKCAAATLLRHQRFNATIDDDGAGLNLHSSVHLGVAVASSEGLTVPVVRDADRRTVLDIAADIHDLASRARDGALDVASLKGGSFTVSSTGGLERARIVSTTPLINLPQTAILWVSRIEDRPRVRNGVLEAGPVLTASISFDHRFIDGAEATAFINTLVAFLEHPTGAMA